MEFPSFLLWSSYFKGYYKDTHAPIVTSQSIPRANIDFFKIRPSLGLFHLNTPTCTLLFFYLFIDISLWNHLLNPVWKVSQRFASKQVYQVQSYVIWFAGAPASVPTGDWHDKLQSEPRASRVKTTVRTTASKWAYLFWRANLWLTKFYWIGLYRCFIGLSILARKTRLM